MKMEKNYPGHDKRIVSSGCFYLSQKDSCIIYCWTDFILLALSAGDETATRPVNNNVYKKFLEIY